MGFRKLSAVLPAIALLAASCGAGDEGQRKETSSSTISEQSNGELLFNKYCTQCHGVNEDRLGPALKGSLARWNNDTTRITAFIRNAGATIESGDPRAVQVAKDWNNALMTPMPFLTDGDIRDLLEYLEQ